MSKKRRLLIANDVSGRWYIRRIASVEHDLARDEKIYRCDKPIANDLTFEQAVDLVRQLEEHP